MVACQRVVYSLWRIAMDLTRDQAVSAFELRKRMLNVAAGESWLVCPYPGAARYKQTHYLWEEKTTVLCGGKHCEHCDRAPIAKGYVPAQVFRKKSRFIPGQTPQLPAQLHYTPGQFVPKIVQLSEHALSAFTIDEPVGTLAVVGRADGRKNGKLIFSWLHGRILGDLPHDPGIDVDFVLNSVVGHALGEKAVRHV